MSSALPAPGRAALVLRVVFLLSGIAGLGYQVTWLRMFAVGIGHELPSMLAVVSAFFGGLALGSIALDGPIARSRRPGAWYAALELVIGLWAPVTALALPVLNARVAVWIGVDPTPLRHWALAFLFPFLALLPATTAMGGSFPAMERLAARLEGHGRHVARLYALNTTGALLGTLVLTFLLLPAVGSSAALLGLGALNLLCAAIVRYGPARGEAKRPDPGFAFDDAPSPTRLRLSLVCTGLCGIGFQVVCVRVMGQVLENTVYSFASGLSLYLLGTAVGAALYDRFAHGGHFEQTFARLAVASAASVAAAPFALGASRTVYESLRLTLGGGALGSIGAELALAALVFLVPTACMGALFSHLVQAARREKGGVGSALAVNMVGSSLAPPVFGMWLLPALHANVALLVAGAGYLLLLVRRDRLEPLSIGAAALGGTAYFAPSLVLVRPPHGGRIVRYEEGVLAAVAVVEDAAGQRMLKVNDRFTMGGTHTGFAEWRQAHLPLLLHPGPERALFLGLGAGSTARAATVHPGLDVEAVELLPEVVEALPLLHTAPPGDFARSQVRYRVADARRYVRATDARFDVIVADLFQPARDGSGALYTREHFQALRARLAPGGLVCQWLPLYQMDLETLRLIVRTFFEVFGDGGAMLGHYNLDTPILGLFAGTAQYEYGPGWFDRRTERGSLRAALAPAALADDLDLFGAWLADRAAMLAFAGPGPLNTDDHPRVTFRAPRFAYDKTQTSYGRALALLDGARGAAVRMLAEPKSPFGAALSRHLAARDLFLEHARLLKEGKLRAATEKLLESLRTDPEFETSLVLGLLLARDSRLDATLALGLLDGLEAARPGDPRVAAARRERFPAGRGRQ